MQYSKKKANFLLIPTLLHNKSKISDSIDVLRELIQCLDFDDNIFEDKVVMTKRDWLLI